MLPRDRLHVVALMLTALASMFQCVGVLFPNWWVLKDHSMKNVVTTFSLFGPVRCSDNLCFPEDVRVIAVPEGMTPPTDIPDDNAKKWRLCTIRDDLRRRNRHHHNSELIRDLALYPKGTMHVTWYPDFNLNAWLSVGRVLSVIGVTLVLATVAIQLIFLKISYESLQLVANSFLVTAAIVSFITGFLFLFKFVTLTEAYVNQRPLGALTYTPAAPGCILFSGVICAIAAIFTALAFRPPRKAAILT